jgi:hypothetical protein
VFLPSALVSFPSLQWYSNWCKREEALNLAHGSSTLVFELGVEEIAAADGGDVEACVLLTFSSVLTVLVVLSVSVYMVSQGVCVDWGIRL